MVVSTQPSGTVTLLFSDIEGSTRLLQRLGTESFAEVLEHHRRLLREVFARHDGYEVDTEGDAFFVTFARAADGVAAAEEAQQALDAAAWSGRVSRYGCGWACTRASRCSWARSTSAWMCIGRHGSWLPAMEGRCCSRKRHAPWWPIALSVISVITG